MFTRFTRQPPSYEHIGTKPLLLVAMDYGDAERAVHLAGLVHDYVDILGIGTLLLKRAGKQVITTLKHTFQDKLVFVDTKTLDLGQLEAQMVFEAGADMMSVCCMAPDSTIEMAIREARIFQRQVLVDLIGVDDVYREVKRLSYLEPDYITIHTGVDERLVHDTLFQKVEIFSTTLNFSPIPWAVAGGLQLDDIPDLLIYNPAIIIVGAAITNAAEPQHAAKHFWERIHDLSSAFSIA